MAIKLEGNGINFTFPSGHRGAFDITGYPRNVSVPGVKVHGKDGEVTDTDTVSRDAMSLEVSGTLKSNSLASARETFNEITNAVNGMPNEAYLVETNDDIRIPVRMEQFTHTREPAKIMTFSITFKAAIPFWEDKDYSEVEFTDAKVIDVPIGNAPLYPTIMLKGSATNPTLVAGNWSFNSHIGNLKATAITDGGSTDPYSDITGNYTETDINVIGSVTSFASLDGAQTFAFDGNFAYVAARVPDALTVVNIASPATPAIVMSLASATDLDGAFDVEIVNNAMDLSSPSTPALFGNIGIVAAMEADAITTINLASPATPSIMGSLSSSALLGGPRSTVATGHNIYTSDTPIKVYTTAFDSEAVVSLSIASPATPAALGSVISPATLNGARGLDLVGDQLYATGFSSESVAVISISSPATMAMLGSLSSNILEGAKGISVFNNKACIAASATNTFVVVNVASPATPAILGSKTSTASLNSVFEIFWEGGNYVYVTGDNMVSVMDISAPATPEIISSNASSLDNTLSVVDTDATANESIVSSKYGYARAMNYKDNYSFASLYQRGDKMSFVVKMAPDWDSASRATRYIFELADTDGSNQAGLYYRNGRLIFGAESTIGGSVSAFSAGDNIEFSGWCDADGTSIGGTTYYAKLFQDGSEIASKTTMIRGCNSTLSELHIGTRLNDNEEEIVKADIDELYLYNQDMHDNYCKGETISDRALDADNLTFKWTSSIATNDHLEIDMENYTVAKYDVSANSTSNEIGSVGGRFFQLGRGAARSGHDENKIDTITLGTPASGEVKYRKLYW